MAERVALKDHYRENRIFLERLISAIIAVVFLLAILIVRFVYLQVFQHDFYSTKSDRYRVHVQSVVPTRGLIYDRNGVLLAENRPVVNLTVVKERADNLEQSLALLETIIGLTKADIDKYKRRLRRRRVPFSSVPLRFRLSEEEIAKISVNQFRLPGIEVEAQLVRYYPLANSTAHSVGYLGAINEQELKSIDAVNYSGTHQMGKTGVEKFYETLLHGEVGYETVEKNARGQIMKVLNRSDPVPGKDIYLHLDSHLQRAAEHALGNRRGAIVAIEPASGGILALVSKPSFDPNLFVTGISTKAYSALNDAIETPLFNRALGQYPPGSTIKPFVALAGLQNKVITYEYTIKDPGWYKLVGDKHIYHDWTWWKNKSGHGSVNLQKAIYQSCDTYFYQLSENLGINSIHDYLFQFGFGQNLTLDIPQASKGILPSTRWKMEAKQEVWFPGETLSSGIGNGYMAATPLQLATATAILADKAHWKEPRILRSVGANVSTDKVAVKQHFSEWINAQDWQHVVDAMTMVVHKGQGGYRNTGSAYPYTAMKKKMLYTMAGKSGTAQVVAINIAEEGSLDDDVEIQERFRDHALFIAFAPAEDPKIALAVLVEHGQGGSSVAGPVAREVIDAYLLEGKNITLANTPFKIAGVL